MMMILGIIENKIHLLAWVHCLEGRQQTSLNPADELVTIDGIVIISRSDVVDTDFIEDEGTAVIEFGENVRGLDSFHLQQSVLGHGMHDDDALASIVASNIILGGGRDLPISCSLRALA